ncbi:hypothetical protein BaRGS_00015345, partial [Batillaria attramentaria]
GRWLVEHHQTRLFGALGLDACRFFSCIVRSELFTPPAGLLKRVVWGWGASFPARRVPSSRRRSGFAPRMRNLIFRSPPGREDGAK